MKLTKGNILRKILVLLVLGVIAAFGVNSATASAASCTGVASSTVYAPSGGYNVYFNVQGQNCASNTYDMQIAQCPGVPSGVAAGWTDSTAGGFKAVCQQTGLRTLNLGMSCDQFTGCHTNNYTDVKSYTATLWYWPGQHYIVPFYQYRTRTWVGGVGTGTPSLYGPWVYAYGQGSWVG